MAYARFSENSDVYIFSWGLSGKMCCCGCTLELKDLINKKEMLEHLKLHLLRGEKVEQHTLERIQKEIDEENHIS